MGAGVAPESVRHGFATGTRSIDPELMPGYHVRRSHQMTDKNVDKAKGRAKEAAGAVTGDSSLKNKGRVDQAKGSVKGAVDDVADKLTGKRKKTK